ncbi:MAG: DNA-binding Lrp family transcriptional regulator [Clostridium sp.]|jgi:DNA-binding Lrp family transcriptional regulator
MLSSLDISIIRKIQGDLPLVPEPYKAIAEELEITENELINKIEGFCESGIIRRFGTTINHRNVGFKANSMVVWKVPDDQIKAASKIMILFSQVSHCYQRPTFPGWPYNVFTMVHAETKQECEKVVKEIAYAINIYEYDMLYSTDELKKVSMKYFIEG